MVAAPKIRCAVVAITADDNGMLEVNTASIEPRFRPSDLLPWADPYIAGMVRKLQAEVRSERPATSGGAVTSTDLDALRAELELPWDGDTDRANDGAKQDDARFADDADRWAAEPESVC